MFRRLTFSLLASIISVGLLQTKNANVWAQSVRLSRHTTVHEKMVYLTFDDGPSQMYTPLILQALRENHAVATFFVLGARAQAYPQLVKQIHQAGHEIGNHGYNHHPLPGLSNKLLLADIDRTDKILMAILHDRPVLYRPPEGKFTVQQQKLLEHYWHPLVLWNVDSLDWRNTTSAAQIIQNVEANVQPDAVVLFHDGVSNSKSTARALYTILPYLRNHGYRFAKLPVPQQYRHSLSTGVRTPVISPTSDELLTNHQIFPGASN